MSDILAWVSQEAEPEAKSWSWLFPWEAIPANRSGERGEGGGMPLRSGSLGLLVAAFMHWLPSPRLRGPQGGPWGLVEGRWHRQLSCQSSSQEDAKGQWW